LVLSSLMAAAATPAAGSWPGREGPIVYAGLVPQQQTDPTRKLDPFVATGLRSFQPGVPGSLRQVTTDSTDIDPQVSPDGRLVVFRRAIDQIPGESVYGIFVARIDGSEVRQLTDGGPGGGSDIEPAFYPSGQRVAFVRLGGSEDPAGRGDIYSIGVDGGEPRRITASAAQERAPAVSPTGRQVAFQCGLMPQLESNDRHICSVRPDGSHRRDLTPSFEHRQEAFDPDFSPSGRIIAFTLGPGTAADIATMRADGTHVRALTNPGRHGGRTFPRQSGYDEPAFSPSGHSVVAVARSGAGPSLVRVRFDDPAHPRPLGEGFGRAPAWTPRQPGGLRPRFRHPTPRLGPSSLRKLQVPPSHIAGAGLHTGT
jgi:Tol biopolymer transport system component